MKWSKKKEYSFINVMSLSKHCSVWQLQRSTWMSVQSESKDTFTAVIHPCCSCILNASCKHILLRSKVIEHMRQLKHVTLVTKQTVNALSLNVEKHTQTHTNTLNVSESDFYSQCEQPLRPTPPGSAMLLLPHDSWHVHKSSAFYLSGVAIATRIYTWTVWQLIYLAKHWIICCEDPLNQFDSQG